MMMIGEYPRQHPTVQIPQWDHYDDSPPAAAAATNIYSPSSSYSPSTPNFNTSSLGPSSPPDYFAAFQRFLPSNDFANTNNNSLAAVDSDSDDYDLSPFDSFSCDSFRMFEFKVRKCSHGRSHDWTECPFAHPGEKARRRDPRKYHYSGTSCPDYRKGLCKKGDACEFAHGVFECWLHPARYRTQPCKDGSNCKRRVCFFAHSPEQLRILPDGGTADGFDSPTSRRGMGRSVYGSSPSSILMDGEVSPPSESPPMTPSGGGGGCYGCGNFNSVNDLVAGMRGLQMGNGNSCRSSSCCLSPRGSWVGVQVAGSSYGSPRGNSVSPSAAAVSLSLRQQSQGFCSQPSTPTRGVNWSGLGLFERWDSCSGGKSVEEELAMERVESGRNLRAKIYGRLSKENSLNRVETVSQAPDFGWVSELVK